MSDIKTLIVSASPRDILQSKEGLDDIKGVPKLLVKYFNEADAYKVITSYFLKHKKDFDYMVIAPDDLIVGQKYYDMLMKDLKKEQYPVLSGVCNVNVINNQVDRLAICIDKLPSIRRDEREFGWADLRNKDHPIPEGIIKVKFAGFPFMFIRKDIIEQIEIKGDLDYNLDLPKHSTGSTSMDTQFCWECDKKGIPIHVDTRVKMVHLAGASPSIWGFNSDQLYIGTRPARVLLIDKNGREKDITQEALDIAKIVAPVINR